MWCLLSGLHSPFPLSSSASIRTCAIGLVPSLSRHAVALPMTFTTENRHRASSSQGSSINGSFLFRKQPHGPINMRSSFPYLTNHQDRPSHNRHSSSFPKHKDPPDASMKRIALQTVGSAARGQVILPPVSGRFISPSIKEYHPKAIN